MTKPQAVSWAVEFVEVHKRVDGRAVLRGVSFGAPAGAVTAIVSSHEEAKTLVFRLITGLERPDLGAVLVGGRDVSRAGGRQLRRLRRGMSVMFQEGANHGFGLFEAATVRENIAYAVRAAGRTSTRRLDVHVGEYLELLGLSGHAAEHPDDLQVALRKRVALARALALRAPLVVLDDFDSGLEPDAAAEVCDLIRREQAARGASYFVTTRNEIVARLVADDVLFLEAGRLAQSDDR